MDKTKYVEAGEVVNTHGVRGEIKILPWVDSPEFLQRFHTLYLDGAPRRLLRSRVHKGCLIAALEGVGDLNAAMALKGKRLWIAKADARLPEGSFFLADILGAQVVTEDGAPVGTLEDVLDLPGNRVYVVRGESEHLIPAVPEFILKTDPVHALVTVRLIDGM